jgi:hypothetical protein
VFGQRHLADDFRVVRVGDIDDRRAVRRPHMADKGVIALGDDLAPTGYVELCEMVKQRGHARVPRGLTGRQR